MSVISLIRDDSWIPGSRIPWLADHYLPYAAQQLVSESSFWTYILMTMQCFVFPLLYFQNAHPPSYLFNRADKCRINGSLSPFRARSASTIFAQIMFHRLRRRQRRKRKEAGNRRRLRLSLMVKKRAGANSLAPYVKHLHSPAFSSSMIDSNVVNCQLPFISVSVPASNDESTFPCLSFSQVLSGWFSISGEGESNTFVMCVSRKLTLRSLSNKESPRCSALCKTWISQSRGHSPPFQCL